jgi:hypothetical protein
VTGVGPEAVMSLPRGFLVTTIENTRVTGHMAGDSGGAYIAKEPSGSFHFVTAHRPVSRNGQSFVVMANALVC